MSKSDIFQHVSFVYTAYYYTVTVTEEIGYKSEVKGQGVIVPE